MNVPNAHSVTSISESASTRVYETYVAHVTGPTSGSVAPTGINET